MLQVTGIQFVNSGLSTAMSGLDQYNRQFITITQTINASTQSWNKSLNNTTTQTTSGFNNLKKVISNFTTAIGTSNSALARSTSGIKNWFVAMMAFTAVKRIINDLFDAFRNLWDAMITGASNTELLTIRFNGLVATTIQNTQGITDFTEALSMAKQPAADLMLWVNQFAVKTMFSRDDIAEVLALGMAFDLTAGQSQTLTIAMADWASGMGLGTDALKRMVVNFGQMMRMGKVTQRELRDLAIGGLFPVNEALSRIAAKAGLTGEALSDFMSKTAESGLPVNALLTEFIAIAEERFPNAAERMAQTWQGVTQNIKDFVTTVLGAAVLGPTMNKIVVSLSELLDKALSPAVRGAATTIGEKLAVNLEKLVGGFKNVGDALGNLLKAFGITVPSVTQVVAAIEVFVNVITNGMNSASQAINNWINTAGQTFAEGAQRFMQWGLDMVTQFAIGVIQGATTALAAAMDVISFMLSFFLAPGSPPRVAPDIDKWGAAAMNEWLHGMTQADFDILTDLQGPIQAALNALAAIGAISKDQVGGIFANLSKQIMQAMHQMEETGKVSEKVFEAIRKAGGMFGKELEDLARKQFALLAATKALEKAQKELSEAQKADKAAKDRVDELTQQYRELVAAGASKDILDAKRAEIKAAMDERQKTKENVGLAEDKVKVAEDAIAPLEEQVKLQEELVQQMISLTQAQKQMNEAMAAGAAIDPFAFANQKKNWLDTDMFDFANIKQKWQELQDEANFDELGAGIAEFQANMENAKVRMAIAQVEFENNMDKMVRTLTVKLSEIFAPIADQWKKDVTPAIDNITGSFNRLSENIEKIMGKVQGDSAFGGFMKTLGKIAGYILGLRVILGVGSWIASPFVKIVKWLAPILSAIAGALVGITPGVNLLIFAVAALVMLIQQNFKTLKADWIGFWNLVGAIYGFIFRRVESLVNFFVQMFNNALDFISGGGIKKGFNDILRFLSRIIMTVLGAIIHTVFGVVEWIVNGVVKAFNAVVDFFVRLWGNVVKLFESGKDLLGAIWKAILKKVKEVWNTIVNWIKGKGTDIKDSFNTLIDNVKKIWETGWSGIKTFFINLFEDAKEGILGKIIGYLVSLYNLINQSGLGTIWNTLWTGIKNFLIDLWEGAQGILSKVVGWLASVWTSISTAVTDWLGANGLAGFVKDFIKAGEDFIMGLVQGVANKALEFAQAVFDVVKNAWDSTLGALGIPFPGGSGPKGPPPNTEDRAAGGVAYNRGLYQLGEQGPEMVIRAGLTGEFFRGLHAMNAMVQGMSKVAAAPVYNNQSSNKVTNYNLSVATAKSTGNVMTDFGIMETLAG